MVYALVRLRQLLHSSHAYDAVLREDYPSGTTREAIFEVVRSRPGVEGVTEIELFTDTGPRDALFEQLTTTTPSAPKPPRAKGPGE